MLAERKRSPHIWKEIRPWHIGLLATVVVVSAVGWISVYRTFSSRYLEYCQKQAEHYAETKILEKIQLPSVSENTQGREMNYYERAYGECLKKIGVPYP